GEGQAGDPARMPAQGMKTLAGARVPYLDRCVGTAGEEPGAALAQSQSGHDVLVVGQGADFLARQGVPLLDLVLYASHSAAREKAFAVLAQGQRGNRPHVATESVGIRLAHVEVPHPDRLIAAAGEEALAVVADRQTADAGAVAAQAENFLAGAG